MSPLRTFISRRMTSLKRFPMTASTPRRKFLLITLLCCFGFGANALAAAEMAGPQLPAKKEAVIKQDCLEDGDTKKAPAPKEPEKEKPIEKASEEKSVSIPPNVEGAGLYDKPTDGSLGADLWQGSDRSSIVKLLKELPASSPYEPVQKLMYGALLSQTDPGLMKNDVAIKDGEDLLSLRLQKLLEAGAYSQALELYSALNLDQPPQSVGKLGILAMLFNNQLSLACVELHTVSDASNKDEFLKTLHQRCDDVKAKADMTYSQPEFAKLSINDKAIMVATKNIKIADAPNKTLSDKSFKEAAPSDIQILMKAAVNPEDKFTLNLRAAEWGLMSPEDLKKSYITTIKLDIRKDPELAVPDKIEDWQKLPYDLQIAMNKKSSDEKWPFIKAAFAIADKYGVTSLLPFAELIDKTNPKDPTFKEIKTAVVVLNRAGYNVSPHWIDIIEKYTPKKDEKATYARLLAAAYISKSDHKKEDPDKALIYKDLPTSFTPSTDFLKFIIENLDKGTPNTHNTNVILENNNLTNKTDYVMQTVTTQNQLVQASHNGHIGETVLLAVTALYETPLDKIQPGMFSDTLSSLRNVGLTEISDTVAIRAVLGDIE